jgi:hypothetical protein
VAGPVYSQFFTKGDSQISGWGLRFTNNRTVVFKMTGQNGNSISSLGVLPTNLWTHVAVTFSGTTARVYLNGLLDRTATWTGARNNNASAVTIGKVAGTLDDARVYSNALTESEIIALYLAGDADGDRLPEPDEGLYSTTRTNRDTDADGFYDGLEVRAGTNPTDSSSFPAVTNNVVGWWKLDESTGTTTADSSGQGNSGGVSNGAVWVTSGIVSNALQFDGVNDFMMTASKGAGTSLALTNDFTLAGWAFTTNKAQTANLLDRRKTTPPQGGYSIAWQTTSTRITIQTPNGPIVPISLTDIQNGQWQHIAYTISGSNYNGFLNGLVAASGTSTNPVGISSNQFFLARSTSGGSYFNGRLDDVRVFSRVLSAGDLLALAETDTDGDGLLNVQETRIGTNPGNPDTDSDGMPDGWEVRYGLNPASSSDASQDSDGDGFTNLQEYQQGTDPWQFNSVIDFIVNHSERYTPSLTIPILPLSASFPKILVSLDGAMANATVVSNSGGSFNYTLSDSGDAQYSVYLQYANAQGQPTNGIVAKSVILDRAAPFVKITSPASNAVLNQAFITLQAVAGDPDPAEVTAARPLTIWINDAPFWGRNGTNITFVRFPVPAGTNSFTVNLKAADGAAHTNQTSRTWTVNPASDTTAPHLTNFNIAATTLFPDAGATWLECTSDDSNVIVRAVVSAGGSGTTTNELFVGGTRVEGFVPLEFGTNTVVVRASDAAGNATSNIFTIIRSDRYRFVITSPTFGDFATAPSNTVSGYVSAKFDEGLPTQTNVTTVTINGVQAVLGA